MKPWAVLAGYRFGLASIALLLTVSTGCPTPRSSDVPVGVAAPGAPNVILILADDQEVPSLATMPRLKALMVDRGTSFSNAFVTNSICCPSRATILRGQYSHNHQVLTNTPELGGFRTFYERHREDATVAIWLKAAGYRTALIGKYLNGYPETAPRTYVPKGWDEWVSPLHGDFYENYNYQLNENGQIRAYGQRDEDYATDVLARRATDFIRAAGQDSRPFFLYVAPFVPHEPATPARRHEQLFLDRSAPRPASFNEADLSDKNAWFKNVPLLAPAEIAALDDLYRKRLQSLQAVDEMVQAIFDALDATGKASTTYVFYFSDNGYHLGEHRLPAGKRMPYEEDIRVPLVVRGPGVPAGRTLDHVVLNNDLAPTFVELARAVPPSLVDGRSLAPLLSSEPPPVSAWRQALLAEHWPTQQRDIPEYAVLRSADVAYMEFANGDRELYDLRADPYQVQSLHATASRDLLASLSARLAQLRACSGSTCRAEEDQPLTPPGAAPPGGGQAGPARP